MLDLEPGRTNSDRDSYLVASFALFSLFFGIAAIILPFYPLLEHSLLEGGLGLSQLAKSLITFSGAGGAGFAAWRVRKLESLPEPASLARLVSGVSLAGSAAILAMLVDLIRMRGTFLADSGTVSFPWPEQAGITLVLSAGFAAVSLRIAMSCSFMLSWVMTGWPSWFVFTRSIATIGFLVGAAVLGLMPSLPGSILGVAAFLVLELAIRFGVPGQTIQSASRPAANPNVTVGQVVHSIGIWFLGVVMVSSILARQYEVESAFFFRKIGFQSPFTILAIGLLGEVGMLIILGFRAPKNPLRLFALSAFPFSIQYGLFTWSIASGNSAIAVLASVLMGTNAAVQTIGGLLVDRQAHDPSIRSTALGLVITAQSAGQVVGSLLCGLVAHLSTTETGLDFAWFWGIWATIALVATALSYLIANRQGKLAKP